MPSLEELARHLSVEFQSIMFRKFDIPFGITVMSDELQNESKRRGQEMMELALAFAQNVRAEALAFWGVGTVVAVERK